MRLLTLASLATETRQVSFQDLTVELDLDQDEVEGLVIEGIIYCMCNLFSSCMNSE